MNGPPTPDSMWTNVRSISEIIAPLSLFAAFLTYIGWVRTRAYFEYFGVNPSLLAFSPQDYVFRSADVSLGGLLVLVLAGAGLLLIDRLIIWTVHSMPNGAWKRKLLLGAAAIASLTGIGVLAWAAGYAVLAITPPIAGAFLLAVATISILRLRSEILPQGSRAATGLLTTLLLVAGLWGATVYARSLGESAALGLVANPNGAPIVSVFSASQLDLPIGGTISAIRTAAFDGHWTYQYSGAVLLTYANDRWFLISRLGDDFYRPAITVLRDSEQIQVETSRTLEGR